MYKLTAPKLIISFLLFGLVAGCAAFHARTTPLEPGAENVVLSKSPASTECEYLGQLTSSDINGDSTPYTSHENLTARESNSLKNKAFGLGANYVGAITEQESRMRMVPGGDNIINQQSITGIAYKCPLQDLNKVVPF